MWPQYSSIICVFVNLYIYNIECKYQYEYLMLWCMVCKCHCEYRGADDATCTYAKHVVTVSLRKTVIDWKGSIY